MPYLVPSLIIAVAILVATAVLWFLLQRALKPRDDTAMMALLQNQVNATLEHSSGQVEGLRRSVTESLETLHQQFTRSLTENTKQVGQRLDSTVRVIGDVRQQLGELETSSKRVLEVGRDIAKLEQVLRAPKLRGSLGELFLGDLLAQILPASHYTMQHHFAGGEIVDAVVRLQAGIVPIDAKFPLENFKRIFAAENDEAKRAAKKAFVKDVKLHIDAIASKYIRMDEGTFDFALMYIPAENVYYETIIKDDDFDGDQVLFAYALAKRVIPVSPNSFYAYLQTVILGLKGMKVEERARDILETLSRLKVEVDRFSEDFRVVGKHLDSARTRYAEAQKRFGKFEDKMQQIDSLAQDVELPAGANGDGAVPAPLLESQPAGTIS